MGGVREPVKKKRKKKITPDGVSTSKPLSDPGKVVTICGSGSGTGRRENRRGVRHPLKQQ